MLTDDQIHRIWSENWGKSADYPPLVFARAIERAARKEAFEECVKVFRNTGTNDMYLSVVKWAEAKAKECKPC